MARSLLYVPGHRPSWVAKAWAAGADAVILDLEDAVPLERKEEARAGVVEVLAGPSSEATANASADTSETGPVNARPSPAGDVWVRAHPEDWGADLDAVVRPGLRVVMVPKAEVSTVVPVLARLDALERGRGLAVGTVGVVPLIETARGVQQFADLAALPRVVTLALGEADLCGDLGISYPDAASQLRPIRLQLIVACAATGLVRPAGPSWTQLDDPEGLRDSCQEQLRQGFRGRTAIHPSQVATINEIFTPSTAEVTAARETLALFEEGLAVGDGAVRAPDGRLLDPATVRGAREVLARARYS